MPRRVLVLATIAAGLAVLSLELLMRRIAREPAGLPPSAHPLSRGANEPLPTLWQVPSYRLVDQTGRTRTPDDLKGSVWVADFIFTSCKSVCPVLSAKMVQVQQAIPDPRLRFVSFSVDARCAPCLRDALGTTRVPLDAARQHPGEPRQPDQRHADPRRAAAGP